jgi:glycosyltransferase involved in cell wall biosynthesis
MQLSVVVPTRNRAHIVSDCLRSLADQTGATTALEIIVVDNGSTDATAEIVAEAAAVDPRVRLVRAPVPGVNRARNAGLTEACGDAIGFVDDDEVVPPDWTVRVLRALADNPDSSGVGGPYRGADPVAGKVCVECQALGAVEAPADAEGRAPRLLGGNMVLRRRAFDAIGVFDERLSGRGDETEWFKRAGQAGLWFHYDPALWIAHRRDVFSTRELLLTQFRQGMAKPLAVSAMGQRFRPRPGRAARAMAHAVRHHCLRGGLTAARELGAMTGMLRHPSSIRTPRSR